MVGQNKIGFWSVVSIVLGSQIGSGIFMLPAGLAKYGILGVASWLASGTGAILLALVFAQLCARFPRTGGPHAYVQAAFGPSMAFFTAWTYWVISWISSSVVVITAIGYVGSLFGGFSPFVNLALEISFLLIFMGLNLLGIRTSGYLEFIFSLLKVVPLLILPLACLPYFNISYFTVPDDVPLFHAFNAGVLLTFWGFIGVETATTPAEAVENPRQTIPRALVLGTLAVVIIYLLSSVAIIGVVEPKVLQNSTAPFADATRLIFGDTWHAGISLTAAIVCLGTLNAWILTSGQIALGAAQDQLFPSFFRYQNARGAPTWGIIISTLGVIPLFFFTLDKNLMDMLFKIIDASVTAFLIVYALCVIGYLRLCYTTPKTGLASKILGWVALFFCGWVLAGAVVKAWFGSDWIERALTLFVPFLIVAMGVPLYFKQQANFEKTA